MRLAALGSAALLLLAPGLSSGQAFTPYFNRTDFFEVAFRGQPTIQDIKYTSEYTGVFPARVCSVVNERGRFLVTVVDYTNAESIHKERLKNCPPDAQSECVGSDDAPGAGSWRYDLYSAVDHATRPFLTRDSKVTHFAWAVVDRKPSLHPGRHSAAAGAGAGTLSAVAAVSRQGWKAHPLRFGLRRRAARARANEVAFPAAASHVAIRESAGGSVRV